MSLRVLYAFHWYSWADTQEGGARKILNGLIVWPEGLHVWFGTIVNFLIKKETWSEHRD